MQTSHIIESNDSIHGIIEQIKHYLPSQSPLKDFVHHNSLHAFQSYSFYEGIFKARDIFGYNVTLNIGEYRNLYKLNRINEHILKDVIIKHKGKEQVNEWLNKMLTQTYQVEAKSKIGLLRKQWKANYKIDLDNKVQPILFRVICSYLDQGISMFDFPHHHDSFIENIRAFENNSFTSLFKSSRVKSLLKDKHIGVVNLLDILVGKENYYHQYLFDQQFSHRGWSGMVATLEHSTDSLLSKKDVSLEDFIFFELLLEIDALDQKFGDKWLPLCAAYNDINEVNIFHTKPFEELDEILMMWQDAFEWSYYDQVLFAVGEKYLEQTPTSKSCEFQAVFCIDERECSLRRHLEKCAPESNTFGAPGFFGVEFYFQAENGHFLEKLCPAPVTPKYLIKESNNSTKRTHSYLYNKIAHTLIGGYIFNLTAGIASIFELISNLLSPKMTPAISNAFLHVGERSNLTIEHKGEIDEKNNLQVGFTIAEMTDRVKGQLLNMGLIENFGSIIYMVAHGSSSANNPHHGAHDCGACSGRPGSVNARVFSYMANHPAVRLSLKQFNIHIPDTTQFIGALHDTAADQIEFYDLDILNAENGRLHANNVIKFESALDLNAKERSRRFASINTKGSLSEVREEIRKRSVSLFQPRPELGHGSNALCIIGRRDMTKNIFLDRRAFLNSYDYRIDPDGALLKNVISPIGPVCGGINLEYYFSRIDNLKLGAGTKLPHNVMGLIGVANSSDGDLRPGLPLQMIEVHDPIRLLVIVEQTPEIINKVLEENPAIKDWYYKNWIHLVAMNPNDKIMYKYDKGSFVKYAPLTKRVEKMNNFEHLFENAEEMSAFKIENATKENLPVYLIN
jgi:uncharacterized protein YbcC (UPF0753/DUF2309 family)